MKWTINGNNLGYSYERERERGMKEMERDLRDLEYSRKEKEILF